MPEVVAKHGDGVALVLKDDDEVTERLGDIADACKRVGRDFDEITKVLLVYVTITDDPSYNHRDGIARHGAELDLGARVTKRYMEAADEGAGANYRIIGTPDQVNSAFERLERLGLDEVVVHFSSTTAPIGGDVDTVISDVEVFAAEVMPNF